MGVADRADSAAVGVEPGPSLEQGFHPLGLVQLLAVGRVAGVDGEVHPAPAAAALGDGAGAGEAVQLPDGGVIDLHGLQRLLGSPCGVEGKLGAVGRIEELDPRRRLLVGQLEVRELAEVEERPPPAGAAALRRRAQLGVNDVGLAGPQAQVAVCRGAGGDDPLLHGAPVERGGPARRRDRGPGEGRDRERGRARHERGAGPPRVALALSQSGRLPCSQRLPTA